MKKLSWHILTTLFFYCSLPVVAQNIVINEVSQGPSGSKEYVELLVIGTLTCSDSCMDIRGWIFDDNNGDFGSSGVAAGCVRFSQDPVWECVKYGTTILLYNNNDPNPDLPPDNLTGANCQFVVPVNSTLFEYHLTEPNGTNSAYPTTGFVAGGDWQVLGMSNTGDSFQILDPADLTTPAHSVSYGNNVNTGIYIAGGMAGNVMYMDNTISDDFNDNSNWTSATVASGAQTPGTANSANNSLWIASMNNNCMPLQTLSISVSSTDVTCVGNNDGTATATIVSGNSPYTYSWSSAHTASSVSGLGAGIYTVTVTDRVLCDSVAAVTISGPSGTITITPVFNSATCNGVCDGSATVAASGGTTPLSYDWSSGSTVTSAPNLCAGQHGLTVTDANGCSVDTTNFVIDEPAIISVTAFSVTSTDCNVMFGAASIDNVTGGTSSVYSYLWENGETNASITGLSTGQHCLTISDPNAATIGGCETPFCITVSSTSEPSITVTATSATCNALCDGTAAVTASGGAGISTYQWDVNSGFQTTATATGLCAGNYDVTVTDVNGCTAVTVTSISEPSVINVATSAVSMSLCNGECANISATASGGNGSSYTYSWDVGSGQNQMVCPTDSTTYQLTVTDVNNCSSAPQNVTVNVAPAISVTAFSVTSTSCGLPFGSASIDNVTGGTSSVYAYLWDSGQTDPLVTGLSGGEHCLSISDPNASVAGGCGITFCVTVNSNSGPSVIATSTPAVCNAQCSGTATATATANGGSTVFLYQWANNASLQTSQTATALCAGSYAVTVTDADGCTATTVANVSQPTAISIVTTGTSPICSGQCTNISATASGGNGGPFTYLWNIGTGQNQVVCPTSSTFYQVTATDANNCQSMPQFFMLNVNPELNSIPFGGNTICQGQSATIGAVAFGGNGGPYSYTWNNGAGVGSPVQVTPLNYPLNTDYIVTISDGCSANITDTVTLKFYPTPVPMFTTDTFNGCQPFTATIDPIMTTLQNVKTCIWEMEDGTFYNGCFPVTHTFSMPGTNDVTLKVFSNDGCLGQYTWQSMINVYEQPVADFTSYPNPTSVLNTEIDFNDMSSGLINQWKWKFYNNNDSTQLIGKSNYYNPTFTFPADTGVFPVNLYVETLYGCSDDTTKYIIINGVYEIYIPNAFTPNGDKKNDFFIPKGTGIDPNNFSMLIFDRWGELIFKSNSLNDPWDGTAREKGSKKYVQNGIYIYKIETKESTTDYTDAHKYVGTVALIR